MKLLAFAASTSRKSINRQLIGGAVEILRELSPDIEAEILDLNDYEMPIFSIDRENEGGIPEPAHRFFGKIGEADALLISYAEHNGAYTAAFKNVYDWASRIDSKVYQGKPMVIMATSPGGRGGASVLELAAGSAPRFGADLRGQFSLGRFHDAFDAATQRPTDPEVEERLRSTLRALLDPAG